MQRYTRHAIVALALAISLLLALQQQRISDLNKQLLNANNIAFKQQLEPGFSCGILTPREAAILLQNENIFVSGTIIPADSPTAAVRQGSPRVDSCSYTAAQTNASYIDIIMKRYETAKIAKDAYEQSTKGILNLQTGTLQTDTITDTYAAGAHYILMNNLVLEISAAKPGAVTGETQLMFSTKIAKQIVAKL